TGVRCGSTDTGACVFGSVICSGGTLDCGGALLEPTTELCNGIDDDCDGTVDDSPAPPGATPASCVEDRGVCAGRTPTCEGASGWQCSLPATYQPTETICDGLNNDCDGATDEGCLSPLPGADRRVDLGTTAGSQNSVQVRMSGDDGSRVYATWMETPSDAGQVFFNRSVDSGDSWGASSTRLDDASGPAIGPRFANVGGGATVNVHWADFRGGTSYREMYRDRSTDFGATFPNASGRLNAGMNIDAFNVETAVSGSNVYVVYEAFTSERSRHVFFLRSTNGGASFGAPLQLDHGSGTSFVASAPQIAASGSEVHVVWRDNRNGALDIFHVRSTDSGATWSASDTRLDGGTAGAASSFSPVVAAESGNVYVAWIDDRNGSSFDIFFNRSTDSGASWGAATRIDDDPLPHDSTGVRIAVTGASRLVVAWVDFRFGFADIIARFSDTAGGSFESAQRLDTGTAPGTSTSFDLAIASGGDLVGAAWADDRAGFLDVHANYSLDGGRTWQPADPRLDSTAAGSSDSERPHVYVGGGAVHVGWID
ncbi:MAG: exo-alpha-sialidase, partial [Actinobacteria bacterium]|nr:exo-alpha-sialidase [Actinomycetota bacterium]